MLSQNHQSLDQIHKYYTVVRQIAQGAFGKVYQCIQIQSQNNFAVKVINKLSAKNNKTELLEAQSKILQILNHPNIVKLKEIRQTQANFYIQMEYVRFGTLTKIIKDRREQEQRLSDDEIAAAMKAILTGVSHLHSLNIIHRDLKPQNILVEDNRDLSTLKITDFGLSIKINAYSTKPNQYCGTLLYMAPQILKKRPYTKSVDIWSSAIIMYMLFNNGKHPLISQNTKISAEQYTIQILKPWPKLQNQLAQDFIQKISKIEPIERYTATEALKHPFLTRNKNDPIPLTYHESFKSFEIYMRYSQKIRLCVILSKYFEISEKILINKSYLDKIDHFNKLSKSYNFKINREKKNSHQKLVSSQHIKQIFSEFQINHNKNQSIGSDSPKKRDHSLNNKGSHMINFSFVPDQCIKIKDFKYQYEQLDKDKTKNKIKAEIINNQNSQIKLQQFLTNTSFSPIKSTQKKRFMINLPKISQSKQKVSDLQTIIVQQKSRIMSPRKRIVSRKKYTRPSQQIHRK